MKHRFLLLAASACALLGVPSALNASSDETCTPTWKLDVRELGCNSRAAMAPGNDSRVNLLLLIRNRAGIATQGAILPKAEWEQRGYGRTFFDWEYLQSTYYPSNAEEGGADYSGSICQSIPATDGMFKAALGEAKGVSAAERDLLGAARGRLAETCKGDGYSIQWPDGVTSAEGREFLDYLKAADTFYASKFADAAQGFAALGGAKNGWVKEAAIYMTARTALNAAQEKAFDDWGGFAGADKVDQPTVKAARAALEAYLKAWPQGRYATSARGLIRRTMWLSGDLAGLAAEYERAASAVDARKVDAALLVNETDNKLLMSEGADKVANTPLVLATLDLMAMRPHWDAAGEKLLPPDMPASVIEGQKAAFAGNEALFTFLQANHAFYVAGDMKKVLALLPDDARAKSFTPLAFSRQVLRGMALAALKDPNETGFWKELIGGSAPLHQRPLAELGLAMSLERRGKLGEVFAPGSLVTDPTTREILLQSSAGPDLLRANARDATRPLHERDVSLFTLLYKQLTRGRYAAFAQDVALVRKGAATESWLYNFQIQEQVPVGMFAYGKFAEGYACPAIAQTARALAANPRDPKAQLCLGDFLRLNGFDNVTFLDEKPADDALGSAAAEFPGQPLARGDIYRGIIANRAAPANERAYALYRAVYCYAPGGNNSCGDEDVDPAVRKGWYNQLKKEYPASPWAKKLRFFW